MRRRLRKGCLAPRSHDPAPRSVRWKEAASTAAGEWETGRAALCREQSPSPYVVRALNLKVVRNALPHDASGGAGGDVGAGARGGRAAAGRVGAGGRRGKRKDS